MRWFIYTAAFVCLATWAAGYDNEMQVRPLGTDGQLELAWDNGNQSYMYCWYTGPHNWVAVDYDISMIQSYRRIDTIRVYSRATWPNSGWDGFRIGIAAMAGSIPGSVLWGPSWVRGTLSGSGWVDASVGYTLPAGANAFVAGMTQYYSYPNCDAYATDNNTVFMGHSWGRYNGSWSLYSSSTGYSNIMIRVIVDTVTAVAPASLGRVKATYY